MDGGSRVRTRTSSLVAGDDPAAEFAHRVETLSLSRQQEAPVESSMPKEWTNEKHRLYLKSMEATFVDQLYGYIDPKFARQQHCETLSTPSGQFKVLRRGSWQKVDFQRPGVPRVNVKTEAQGLLKSPWIQHFRCVKKPPQQDPQNSRRLHSSSNHHDHSNNNYTEMSDQNFVDEDMEEDDDDDAANGASNTCSSKRIKVVVVTDHAPHSDQVVPFRNSPAMVVDSVDHKCMSAASR